MDDMVKCPTCKNEVAESDICKEHGECLWCDTECKRRQAKADEE